MKPPEEKCIMRFSPKAVPALEIWASPNLMTIAHPLLEMLS